MRRDRYGFLQINSFTTSIEKRLGDKPLHPWSVKARVARGGGARYP